MTLLQFISDENGKIKRGARSRVAEHLKITFGSLGRYLSGEWEPSIGLHKRIQDMIHARISIEPFFTRPDMLPNYRKRKKIRRSNKKSGRNTFSKAKGKSQ